MTPSAWMVLLTDTEDDPCLVNLLHVDSIVVHVTGASCITFSSREAVLVRETPGEIARMCAAGSLFVGEE